MFVLMFYMFYAWTNVDKLISNGDNYETSYHQLLDEKSLDDVYYKDSDMISFFVFSKQMNYSYPLYLGREQEKYIEIGYQLMDVDYRNESHWFPSWIKARQCEREKDFGKNNVTKKYFDNWDAGYSLICPDYHNDTHLVLKNTEGNPVQKNFEF